MWEAQRPREAPRVQRNGCQCHAATTLQPTSREPSVHGHRSDPVTDRGGTPIVMTTDALAFVQSNIMFFIRLFETTYREPYPNQNILIQNGRGCSVLGRAEVARREGTAAAVRAAAARAAAARTAVAWEAARVAVVRVEAAREAAARAAAAVTTAGAAVAAARAAARAADRRGGEGGGGDGGGGEGSEGDDGGRGLGGGEGGGGDGGDDGGGDGDAGHGPMAAVRHAVRAAVVAALYKLLSADAPVGAPPEGNAKEVTRCRRRVTTTVSSNDGIVATGCLPPSTAVVRA